MWNCLESQTHVKEKIINRVQHRVTAAAHNIQIYLLVY